MLSQTSRYALHALIVIARSGGLANVRVIAEEASIPRNYLGKILHVLVRRGLLRSSRGVGGGFWLARPPQQIPLIEIIEAFEDRQFFARCLLGSESCPEGRPCAAHALWAPIVEQTRQFFEATTLADLLAEGQALEALAGPARLPSGSELSIDGSER